MKEKPKILRNVYNIDATDQTVGRLASKIAVYLRGKDHPGYNPRIDNGGIVEIKNINKLKFSGKKFSQKKYYHFSGYPGGLKTRKLSEIAATDPGEILSRAVKQMLPANRRRKVLMKRLIIK